jgi:hypothetical protein
VLSSIPGSGKEEKNNIIIGKRGGKSMEQNQLPGNIYFQGDMDSDQGFSYDQSTIINVGFPRYRVRIVEKLNILLVNKI